MIEKMSFEKLIDNTDYITTKFLAENVVNERDLLDYINREKIEKKIAVETHLNQINSIRFCNYAL